MRKVKNTTVLSPNRLTVLMTLFIGVVFLWTSSAYLSWTAHLTPLVSPALAYMATECYGTLAQVAGLALFVLLVRSRRKTALRPAVLLGMMALDGVLILPMLLSGAGGAVLAWGIVMNLFHGGVAGGYLLLLAARVPKNRRALCFGVGYALGNIGSWLLSLPGRALSGPVSWIVLVVFIAVSAGLLLLLGPDGPMGEGEPAEGPGSPVCLLAAAIVFLLALTNQFLLFFPAQAYLADTVRLEFVHLFYAGGLVIAALINDKKRVAGLVLAVVSLCCPLLSLSLYRFTELLPLLSILGYIAFGFCSVYRAAVFTDLSDGDAALLFLAPVGLLFGKAGEGTGAALGQVIGDRQVLLSVLTALLFAAVIVLAFVLYIRLYSARQTAVAGDPAGRFCRQYRISAREREVLLVLLEGKTNPDIAGALNISENTVKFHIKNILKKTACANRAELLSRYQSER